MKRIYFDTEFTELSMAAELISIGLVYRDSFNELRYFYAEIDIDKSKCNKWIKDNVIKNCLFINKSGQALQEMYGKLNKVHNMKYITGSKQDVAKALNILLEGIYKENNDKIEFVSDVSSYDFVLLVDLLTGGKTALDLPSYIVSDCYNINQTMMSDNRNSLGDAFDVEREGYLTEEDKRSFILTDILGEAKHNALWDAYVIMKIGDMYEI